MTDRTFDVVRQVLDHALVDAEGLPCGMVDDVVLEGGVGDELRIVALIVGPGAALRRLPRVARWLFAKVAGRDRVRVPWEAIAHIGERIELAAPAAELGLGRVDRRLGAWIARVPGGSRGSE